MADPFYLLLRTIDAGWDMFKLGRAAGVDKKVADAGRRVVQAVKNGDFVDNAGNVIFGAARKGVVGAANQAAKAGGKTEAWWRRSGKPMASVGAALAQDAGNWFRQTASGRRTATTAVAAGVGYYTADADASFGEKFGRAVGFGVAGNYAARRFQDPTFTKNVQGMFRNLGGLNDAKAGSFKKRLGLAGKRASRALNLPETWGYKKSIAAGALYGMMSDDTSVMEGAVGGAALHFGIKKMGGVYNKVARTAIRDAWKSDGLGAAYNAVPVFKTAMYGGAIMGVYGSLGNGGTGFDAIGGGIRGGMIGAGIGGVAKAAKISPTATMAGAMGTLAYAGHAAEAVNTVASAGAPGFDTLNADGDLALALHRMRHG